MGEETAEAPCPRCRESITCTVTKRARKVVVGASHFKCGGWWRGQGRKKGDPNYSKGNLPGTWVLKPIKGKHNEFETRGKHLLCLGMRADEPLIFTVVKKLG